ncbi:MAG: elongation factor 4 [Candidatus Nealsonbacteria bacterium]|nr:elongation factor 4 [Candidatus Nealsonbacteria bacterium]
MKNIRNFVIISHIDHGKSTLADRFLELTGTIPKGKMRSQFLDMMDLEREKGITIKMQPVRMKFKGYTLNLIDTPGHVDFNYEVSRSLAAVEGGILLVDASKGIQAQTIANLQLAREEGLSLVSAVNKIDLRHASPEETKQEIAEILQVSPEEVFSISAKVGTNVESLLEGVIEKAPPPQGDAEKPLKALIFDSEYDPYQGVVAYVRVFDGRIKKGEKIYLSQAGIESKVREVGYFSPFLKACDVLGAGEIGYIATGVKESSQVRTGETITKSETKDIKPFPGYRQPKPMVFASIFPENPDNYELLKDALNKLKLNDAALSFQREKKEYLGRGFRCGFLGSFHAEIIFERVKREYGLELIVSTPSVVYRVVDSKGEEELIFSASDWPEKSKIREVQEPWVALEITTPSEYLGNVYELLDAINGEQVDTRYLSRQRLLLVYEAPLRKIISGFFDQLKGATQGFASMNYEVLGYRKANLVKIDILIAGEKEEVFSRIVDEDEAYQEGRRLTLKLKEILPSQLFAVPIQAAIGGKIIARETKKALRKDVTAPLYGGDYTRKRKLLEQQKTGKKKLKEQADVHIPPEIFLEMFRS